MKTLNHGIIAITCIYVTFLSASLYSVIMQKVTQGHFDEISSQAYKFAMAHYLTFMGVHIAIFTSDLMMYFRKVDFRPRRYFCHLQILVLLAFEFILFFDQFKGSMSLHRDAEFELSEFARFASGAIPLAAIALVLHFLFSISANKLKNEK